MEQIPTICMDGSTAPAHSLFNPNGWGSSSKAIITSCSAQFGLLLHSANSVRHEEARGSQVCELRLRDLCAQWRLSRWDLARCRYFVEVPAVHVCIQAFLAGGKALLDLLAQLVSAEGLVRGKIDGFHKKGSVIGGKLLRTLNSNGSRERQPTITELCSFLEGQKRIWIDDLVKARDDMAHPQRGMYQVLWEIELAASEDQLRCERVVPPSVAGRPFDKYIEETTAQVEMMAATFLHLVRLPGS